MSDANKLLKLKEKIEDGKVQLNKLQGKREEVIKNLKEEFNCKGPKSGKVIDKAMGKEIKKQEDILKKEEKTLLKKVGGE